MTKPTVSLCMIVRDEEKNLSQCLKGVADLVSEIIVVDTGSTDDTRKIAVGFGAKVSDFPWNHDFSAARNESCRHATSDYIFWLDADDRIDGVNLKRLAELFQHLATLDPSRDTVFMMACLSKSPQLKSDIGVSHGRLFPNRHEFRWVGRVHERVDFREAETMVRYVNTGVEIRHEGYENAVLSSQKRYRNSLILEQEFVVNPDDVWNLFYLGRERNWQGNMPEALRFLQRSIRLDPLNRAVTTPYAFLYAADSLRRMRRTDEALRMLEEGLSRFCDFAPLLFVRAWILRDLRRLAEAEPAFRKLVALAPHQLTNRVMWFDLQRERWRVMLGHVLCEQGRHHEAEAEYRLALREHPDCREAWFALGQLAIFMGKPREVEPIARRLETFRDCEFEAALLRAHICVLDCNFVEGRHWISRALAIRPDDISAHAVRAVLLFREGRDWEQCREALETVLSRNPNDTEARQRLEQVRARMIRQERSGSVGDFENGSVVHPASMPLSDLGDGCGLAFSC